MIEIVAIQPDSAAAELELRPGDRILAVNGREPVDFLDYHLACEQGLRRLEVQRCDGEQWDIELELAAGDEAGIEVEQPQPVQCGNRCLFCFVHQLPRGMRRSLYIKDEDYRYSYLYGAYVTLSNLTEADFARIVSRRLSPLYVSVHATDPAVRNRLLGRDAPPIMEQLQRLVAQGIQLHTQIVACPGINDGDILQRSIAELAALHPGVLSLAVVSVGLTGHRRHLPPLRTFTAAEAEATVALVEHWQRRLRRRLGTRFVWPVDEFYLRAGRPLPALARYEELPQLENGVGLLSLFRREAREVLAEAGPLGRFTVSAITGTAAAGELSRFARRLRQRTGVTLQIYPVTNRFFGGATSVTGLVTGRDLIDQLRGAELGRALLIPDVTLRQGETVFLDDVSLADVEQALQLPVLPVESSPWGLLAALEDLAGEAVEIIRPSDV